MNVQFEQARERVFAEVHQLIAARRKKAANFRSIRKHGDMTSELRRLLLADFKADRAEGYMWKPRLRDYRRAALEICDRARALAPWEADPNWRKPGDTATYITWGLGDLYADAREDARELRPDAIREYLAARIVFASREKDTSSPKG